MLRSALALFVLVSPAQAQLYSLDGTGLTFGLSIEVVGDLDGDGVMDFATGGGPLGSSSAGAGTFSGADGSLIWHVPGSVLDLFGSDVSAAGDANGDGVPDVIVNAAGASSSSGRVALLSGVDGTELNAFVGSPGEGGGVLSPAGDMNADGFDDFLHGIPTFGGGAGRVRVYSGQDLSVLFEYTGSDPNESAGQTVCALGDLNSDGFDDFAHGSGSSSGPGFNLQALDAPIVHVVSGVDRSTLFTVNWSAFCPSTCGTHFAGLVVNRAGDVNLDGVEDLLVANEFGGQGAMRVFSGADGSQLLEIPVRALRVEGAGDVDGDGLPDLIAAVTTETFGSQPEGAAKVYSGADGSLLRTFYGFGTNGVFPFAVAGPGDLNGDGFADILAGSTTKDLFAFSGAVPPSVPIGTLCAGDGGDQMGCTDCPCSNNAPVGSGGGCLNAAGRSGLLVATGTGSVTLGDLGFTFSGGTSSSFAVLVSGENALPNFGPCRSGSGIQSPLLDGLRCVGVDLRRHGGRATDSTGLVLNGWGPPAPNPVAGIANHAGFLPGQTRMFSVFYREDPALQCGTGQNTANALSLCFGL